MWHKNLWDTNLHIDSKIPAQWHKTSKQEIQNHFQETNNNHRPQTLTLDQAVISGCDFDYRNRNNCSFISDNQFFSRSEIQNKALFISSLWQTECLRDLISVMKYDKCAVLSFISFIRRRKKGFSVAAVAVGQTQEWNPVSW